MQGPKGILGGLTCRLLGVLILVALLIRESLILMCLYNKSTKILFFAAGCLSFLHNVMLVISFKGAVMIICLNRVHFNFMR